MDLEQYSQIKSKVWNILHIDLNSYKSEQMCRRLDSWLVRSNVTSWDEYFRRVQADTKEMSKFRDYLTINVSEFFRDADRWKTIQEQVIPQLLKESQAQRGGRAGLRIWSAGCSTGQEPYTLAIIMEELAALSDYSILATDLDRGALQKAMERGPYSQDDVRNVSVERRLKYFDQVGNTFRFKEKFSKRIKFRELNLFLDPFDTNLDLIVCRNVIIYFTTEAKQGLYKHFQSALRPGGILFLGGTEIIPYPNEYGLRSQGISLYKRD